MEVEVQHDDNFHFDINIKGPEFKENSASLYSTLQILDGYRESFNVCLEIATKHYASKTKLTVPPSIKLESAQTGSLDVSTIIDIIGVASGTIAPFVPDMVLYAWQLYQKSHEFVSAAVKFFTETGHPVTINVDNSPGAVTLVNVGNGTINVSPDVLYASRQNHKSLERIAKQIQHKNADTIDIFPSENIEPEHKKISFHKENENSFSVKSTETLDTDPIPILCGLYSLNTRTLNGRLEILEDKESRILPFSISDDSILKDCVDGLKAKTSTVFAIREMEKNALGETRIKKIHITGIVNNFEN